MSEDSRIFHETRKRGERHTLGVCEQLVVRLNFEDFETTLKRESGRVRAFKLA